jgi:hypothetical protein
MLMDVGRALAAAAATIAVFRLVPHLPPPVAMPLCVIFFGLAALALGLLSLDDVAGLRALVARPGTRPSEAGPAASE